MKKVFLLLMLLFFFTAMFAQVKSVFGRENGESSEPISDIDVIIKCTRFEIITDKVYNLVIDRNKFVFHFTDARGNIIAPADSSSGLLFSGSKVVKSGLIITSKKNKNERLFWVINEAGDSANVHISFDNGIAKFQVIPFLNKKINISLRLGGMPVAHGLGDAGAFGESFNLVAEKNTNYEITHNGGTKRWLSTFVIFPQNKLAGVFFDSGKKNIVLGPTQYQMNIETSSAATFYYFVGSMNDIYKNYKFVRNQIGYLDIKPQYRLFELGWESWDALGWNTDQKTVKSILEKFLDAGYPIRWAVTGSGFWEKGGTTTSFGKWGEKFSDPKLLKTWMHSHDIKWMIGQRINLVPAGGPYYPVTDKRDRDLKVNFFNGNELSISALEKNILLKDSTGNPIKMTSSIFPIVPCYLIDGNVSGAAKWFQRQYSKWKVDGIKEDTMMDLGDSTSIFNKSIYEIAHSGGLVMARCGDFSAPGTLLRINDTKVADMEKRTPINYLQYAASGVPNVYSDVIGVHSMHNLDHIEQSLRHAWLTSLTAGMAVGAYPEGWSREQQLIYKKAIDFHYTLVPYLYSAAMKTYKTGFPYTLTPLSIAYPDDSKTGKLENFEWLIGESILAIPLLKNINPGKIDIYLPEGIWYDYETEEKYEGPLQIADYKIPLNKIPCFIGGKGILIYRDIETNQMKAKIFPTASKVTDEFYGENGNKKSTINIENPDWLNISVLDKNTNKMIRYRKDRNSIEFDFMLGHNYLIK